MRPLLWLQHDLRARDEQVTDTLVRTGRRVGSFRNRVSLGPGTLRTQSRGMGAVYSPFRRASIARLMEEGLPEVETSPESRDASVCMPDRAPVAVRGLDGPTPGKLRPAGENETKKRLDLLARAWMRAHKDAHELLSEPGTSKLSPYLVMSAISIRGSKFDSGTKVPVRGGAEEHNRPIPDLCQSGTSVGGALRVVRSVRGGTTCRTAA